MVLEKLLQTLPRRAATSIRDKEPKTSKEAARLAQYYFQDRNVDPDDPRWMRRGDDGDYMRSHRDQFRHHHDENLQRYPERFNQGRSYGYDQSQRDDGDYRRSHRDQFRRHHDEILERYPE